MLPLDFLSSMKKLEKRLHLLSEGLQLLYLETPSEAAMNDTLPLNDPKLQWLVQDFDALADLVQSLIAGDRRRPRQETVPAKVLEFTTEWQMGPSAEMAHSF